MQVVFKGGSPVPAVLLVNKVDLLRDAEESFRIGAQFEKASLSLSLCVCVCVCVCACVCCLCSSDSPLPPIHTSVQIETDRLNVGGRLQRSVDSITGL